MIAPREFHLEYRRSAQRPYRPPQYERVMLPLTVLRRFDCVLLPTKAKVLAEYERWGSKLQGDALDAKLNQAAGQHLDRLLDFTGSNFHRIPPCRPPSRRGKCGHTVCQITFERLRYALTPSSGQSRFKSSVRFGTPWTWVRSEPRASPSAWAAFSCSRKCSLKCVSAPAAT